MRNLLLLAWVMVSAPVFLSAQLRLLIAGNTADADPAFFTALERATADPSDRATVLLAGDFIPACTPEMLRYDATLNNGAEAFPTLTPLLRLMRDRPATEFYLLPGDRDWDASGERGLSCVTALEAYLKDQKLANLHWPLDRGCPGPEAVALSPTVRLLLLNTQWWNHPYDKPVPADAECAYADPYIALDELVSEIEENQDQNVLIAGHFPPVSQGRAGGQFPLSDHLSPPLAGTFSLAYRQNVGTPAELSNPRFRSLADKLREYSSQFGGLLFLGAQDRSQQLIGFHDNYVLNAGAAGAGDWVADRAPALHTSRTPGLTELRFAPDGSVGYRYLSAEDLSPEHEQQLFAPPCQTGADAPPANPAFPPCEVADGAGADPDRFTAPARAVTPGAQYQRTRLGQLFLGKHYRDVWTTPVEVPVLQLGEAHGGLQPVRRGGGRQTTSLVLRAANGESYAFRSVDKDPAGTFSFELRQTLIGDAVRDQTSSGHPYGALIVAPLLERIDILHATPELYTLAPGDGLENYNATFGGMLGTLEIRPQGDKPHRGEPGTFGADDVLKSYELFRARYDDQEVRIDYDEFVRARLFDLLIGDWSKHEDNWKWALYEEGDLERIRPIPRDRDNAFSRLDGLFPWLASRRWAVPNLEHFGYRRPDIRSLTFQARHMDRLLLSSLTREDYRRQAEMIRTRLTDAVLEQAVREIPAPAGTGKQNERYLREQEILLDKLRARRDDLPQYADAYYLLQARTVDVVGTNDEESFALEALPDGRLMVTVTDLKGKSEGQTLYARTFLPAETREVRIYGLGDDDTFATSGPVGKEIRVRLIGGRGEDSFTSAGDAPRKVYVYDRPGAEAAPPAPGFRFVNNWRDALYHYDRTAPQYHTLVPRAAAGYNSYNGAVLGAGLVYTRRSFTRRDFSTRYRLFAQASSLGNVAVEGSVEFGEVIRRADLVLSSRVGRPDLYNFFYGLGNHSEQDPTVDRNAYNLVQIQHFSVEGGLRHRFAGRSYVHLTTGYQNNQTTDREGTILDRPDRLYGDGALAFGYVEPEVLLDLRDHPVFPTRGVLLEASHKQAYGNDATENFGVSRVAAELHLTPPRLPVSLGFRTGYARSSGTAPFYELPSLGRQNGLRGYQQHRFVGDGYLFYNMEVRFPLANIQSRIVPFTVGLRAFYDRGKILQEDEDPGDFHTAYGGGFYVIPLSRSFTFSVLLGFSEEETALLQLGLGTTF